jgi:hypothetical protein
LLALGRTIAWAPLTRAGFALLILGICVVGAGIAFPYASAPWIALAGLAPTQTGKGLRRAELVQLSGRHRRGYRWRDRFGIAGFEGVLKLVGLSALPLPQPGRPEEVL